MHNGGVIAGRGRVRPVEDLLGPAVAETVARLDTSAEDVGAVKLAIRYAAVIDDAAVVAAGLAEALEDLDPEGVTARKRVAALAAKVEAQQVLLDLGPRLLSVLESLGASPKARAAMVKGRTSGTGGGKLAALRGDRAG